MMLTALIYSYIDIEYNKNSNFLLNYIESIDQINNSSDFINSFSIPFIITIVILKIFQRLSKKNIEIKPNNNKNSKEDLKKIKIKISKNLALAGIDEKYKIKFSSESTSSKHNTLYISLNNLKNILDKKSEVFFIIHHEIFHEKIYDHSIGYINNIIEQVIKIVLLFYYFMFLASYLSMNVIKPLCVQCSHFLITVIEWAVFGVLFLTSFKVVYFLFSYPQYIKECLCDRYAAIKLKEKKFNVKKLDIFSSKKKSIKHPPNKIRKNCQSGHICYSNTNIYIFIIIIFLSYFPSSANDQYMNILMYICIISTATILSIIYIISDSRWNIFNITIGSIILSFMLYEKSIFFNHWLYERILLFEKIPDEILENTITHILVMNIIFFIFVVIGKGLRNENFI